MKHWRWWIAFVSVAIMNYIIDIIGEISVMYWKQKSSSLKTKTIILQRYQSENKILKHSIISQWEEILKLTL